MPEITAFGPDFPFAFEDWISHPAGLGTLPADVRGERVAALRRSSRDTVEAARPTRRPISRTLNPCSWRSAISIRSSWDRYLLLISRTTSRSSAGTNPVT